MFDPALKKLVRRYQRGNHQRPMPEHTVAAFEALVPYLQAAQASGQALHLDSCCGVGASTARWAAQHPDAFVVGVDKSAHRLDKHEHHNLKGVRNYRIMRADCDALWALLVRAGWCFEQHNLWYPNPWPKPSHRQRRWYGMPALAQLVRLQKRLSVRSNCLWYVEDFAWALRWWGYDPVVTPLQVSGPAMTPFERKYAVSGQALWALRCEFDSVVDHRV